MLFGYARRLLGADRRRLPARRRRLVVRGRRAVRRRLVPEGAAGLRARHLRHGEHRHGDRRSSAPRRSSTTGAARRSGGSTAALLLVGGRASSTRWPATRPRTAPRRATARCCGRAGGCTGSRSSTSSPSAASSRWRFLLPTLLQDWFDYSKGRGGRRARPGFIDRGDARAPCRRLARRPRRRVPGARARLRRDRDRRRRARGARAHAADRPDHDRVPDARRPSSARATAPSSSSCPPSSRTTRAPPAASSAPPAGSAASSRRSSMGLVKDAEGTYTLRVRRAARLRRRLPRTRRLAAADRARRGAARRDASAGAERLDRGSSRAGGMRQRVERARRRTAASGSAFYRDRWQHDQVVRSTHGVNCTGSCSWKIHVKDGIVAWETQQTDYPSNGPDVPEYEPRGCPRGASFSWYVYSPLRVRYPYVRGVAARALPRGARADRRPGRGLGGRSSRTPRRRARYKSQRGKGGFVRASWDEVAELIAAAHVHTIQALRPRPDRRLLADPGDVDGLVRGGHALPVADRRRLPVSFYDWYADLPPASPQIWGDQTDVPESADWWNASYVILWGSNIPQTRTPDAHFMTEARYRGPEGGRRLARLRRPHEVRRPLAARRRPARDGALALAMAPRDLQGVLRRAAGAVLRRLRAQLHRPPVPRHAARARRRVRRRPLPARLRPRRRRARTPSGRPSSSTSGRASPAVPNGSIGFRWGEEGVGSWNLELGELEPALTLLGRAGRARRGRPAALRRRRLARAAARYRRGVPAKRVGGQLVTTVFDLLAAQLGVRRGDLPGEWPAGYDDPQPYTPAWQEEHHGRRRRPRHPRSRASSPATRSAPSGRSMIVMGAGTNHWFHSDQIYRAMLSLVLLCGCQGVNGGGWAHYVGQEKVRPITGWSTLAFALDWAARRASRRRRRSGSSMSDQWRYQRTKAGEYASPLGRGTLDGMHLADCVRARGPARLDAVLPELRPQPARARRRGGGRGDRRPPDYVVRELKAGRLRFAAEDPDAPENFPRVLTLWRANLLGSSSKGHEYFLRHVLGVRTPPSATRRRRPELRPRDVVWREEAPDGQARPVHDDRLPHERLGALLGRRPARGDLVREARPLLHRPAPVRPLVQPGDPAAVGDAQRLRHLQARSPSRSPSSPRSTSASAATSSPRRSCTTRRTSSPSRSAGARLEARRVRAGPRQDDAEARRRRARLRRRPRQVAALGPLVEELGIGAKGIAWKPLAEVEELRRRNGERRGGRAGRPASTATSRSARRSSRSRGSRTAGLALEGFRALEERTGLPLADLAEEHADVRITFGDTQVQPRKVIASPEWSGTGVARAPLLAVHDQRRARASPGGRSPAASSSTSTTSGCSSSARACPPTARRSTCSATSASSSRARPAAPRCTSAGSAPHSKWSIHSEFQDNLHMLTLFRGGPVVWISRRGRRGDRRRRQRLGRGLQPQRRDRLPRGRLAPHPEGDGAHVPLAGPARERPALASSPGRAAAPTTRVTRISIKPTY